MGGRYFAMDRDRRWDRTELAFATILGRGQRSVPDALEYLTEQYRQDVTDEFIPPASVPDAAGGEESVSTTKTS